jgi:hypothetical protein
MARSPDFIGTTKQSPLTYSLPLWKRGIKGDFILKICIIPLNLPSGRTLQGEPLKKGRSWESTDCSLRSQ